MRTSKIIAMFALATSTLAFSVVGRAATDPSTGSSPQVKSDTASGNEKGQKPNRYAASQQYRKRMYDDWQE